MPARKEYNTMLAKEFLGGNPEHLENNILSEDERNELGRCFPNDNDHTLGIYIYSLRKCRKTKTDICRFLSVDKGVVARIYGTIMLSKFLAIQLNEVLADGHLTENAPTDPIEAQTERVRKIANKMHQILNGITADKVFDADLPSLTSSYQDLMKMFRLETGQSTENILHGKVMNAEYRQESAKKLAGLSKQLDEVQRLFGAVREKLGPGIDLTSEIAAEVNAGDSKADSDSEGRNTRR